MCGGCIAHVGYARYMLRILKYSPSLLYEVNTRYCAFIMGVRWIFPMFNYIFLLI
jgi:hypothetical protein